MIAQEVRPLSVPASLAGVNDEPEANSVPFWALMFFLFVLFIAPYNLIHALRPLYLAKTSAALAIGTYIWNCMVRGRPLMAMTPEVRLLLWFVLWALLSIPFSLWPGGSLNIFVNQFLKSVSLFFLVANLVNTPRRVKFLLAFMAACGGVYAVNALFNYRAGNFAGGEGYDWSSGEARIESYDSPLTGNPNDLALTLNIIVALVIGLAAATDSAGRRSLLYALVVLMSGGVLVSYSRGGFIGLALIFLVVFIRQYKKRGPVVFAPLVFVLPLMLLTLPEGYTNRLYSIVDSTADVTGSSDARWIGMRAAFAAMVENPLLGCGLDMNILAIRERVGEYTWTEAHNVYLQIGADMGIPGLVIYLLLALRLAQGLRLCLRHLQPLPEHRSLYVLGQGIEVCFLSFLVQILLFPIAYHFYFYLIAGLAMAFQAMATGLTGLPQEKANFR